MTPAMQRLKEALAEMGDGPTEFPALLSVGTKRADDESCFQIEDSWCQLATKEAVAQLTKTQRIQQENIWEIFLTEVKFIKSIRVAVDFYLCTLLNLQASGILNEIDTESIFSNLQRVEDAHSRFWKERLSAVIGKAREEKRLPSALDLADAFDGFEDLFACYTTYTLTNVECLSYLRDKMNSNEVFRHFVQWAQKHPRCKRLMLYDLLPYPMSRLTKYGVFLEGLDRATPDGRPKSELARRTSEVKGFVASLRRSTRGSRRRDDGGERIAVEDEVVATLNPRSPTAERHAGAGGGPRCGSPLAAQSPSAVQSPKMKRLHETLDELLEHGLQDFPALLSFGAPCGEDQADAAAAAAGDGNGDGGCCFELEETWRSLVGQERADALDAGEAARLDAFWDLLAGEAGLVEGARIVGDFYSCTVLNLQASLVLNEIETEKVFGGAGAVRAVHARIWRERFLPVLRTARAEQRLPTAAEMAGAFRGFTNLLAPYLKLVGNQVAGLEYLREQTASNEMLRHFLSWAEKHPDSRGHRLYDLLLAPARQLCRYPVLLTAMAETAERRARADLLAGRAALTEFLGHLGRAVDRKQDGPERDAVEVPRLLQLQQTLGEFMSDGLQDFPTLLAFGAKKEADDEECLRIGETWRRLAAEGGRSADPEGDERAERVWRLVLAEACFIREARLIVDLYLSTLLNLQSAMLLNEIETERIFRNATAIERQHTKFWKGRLSGILDRVPDGAGVPALPAGELVEAFRGFATTFAPYAKFCNSQSACAAYLKQQTAANPCFAFFLDWVRTHPRSGGHSLPDLLEAPARRLAAYPVLLEALEEMTPVGEERARVARRKSEVRGFVARVLSSTKSAGRGSAEISGVGLQRSAAFRVHSVTAVESADEPDRDAPTVSLQKALDDLMVKGIPEAPGPGAKAREPAEDCSRAEKQCDLWRQQADQQEAIRKIVTSEIGVLKDLRVVVGLYRGGLLALQARGLLTDARAERIFGNAADVEAAHAGFWAEGLSQVVGRARAEARLPSLPDLAEALAGFAERFAPYVEFCRSRAERARYLRELAESDEGLAAFLAWARRHPDSQGPCLADLLDYCAERVAAYPRLLAALEKTLDFPDRARLSPRIKEVRAFVTQLSDC